MTLQKAYYRDWTAARRLPVAFVVSRCAAPLSRSLAAMRVNPNAITAVAALFGTGAVVAAAIGAFPLAATGLLGFLLLDHADGQVARATNRRTAFGGYIDGVADLLIDLAFLAAVAAWGIKHDPRLALVAVAALASYAAQELISRHNRHTLILRALRANDYTTPAEPPTIRGAAWSPIAPHRDLNIAILALGLLIPGALPWSLTALTAWWLACTSFLVLQGIRNRKPTTGVLSSLAHGDNH